MQLRHTLPVAIITFLARTALGASCYTKGQKWKDVGVETVVDEAFRRVCATTNLAGKYPKNEAIRSCENVAENSFLVTIKHIDSMDGLDPWLLSSRACFNLLKKVYNACPNRCGSMILTAGGSEDNPWVNADVRLDPDNGCCGC